MDCSNKMNIKLTIHCLQIQPNWCTIHQIETTPLSINGKSVQNNQWKQKNQKKRLHTKPPRRSCIIFTITNPTATHTRSHCKPPSSPIIMLSFRLYKAYLIYGFVDSTRSVGFVCHQYERERERERVWKNERERRTNFLKFFILFFCFFILLLLIIFYIIYMTWQDHVPNNGDVDKWFTA